MPRAYKVSMRAYTSLALCTLAVNWTLTILASIAVAVMYCLRFVEPSFSVRPDDALVLVSLVVGVVLVSLSTWAVLDEGQAEHQEAVSGSQLEMAAKVSPGPFPASLAWLFPRFRSVVN